MSDFARCRSCGAEVIWTVTTNGKRMPVDANPRDDGNLFLFCPEGASAPLEAVALTSADPRVAKAAPDRSRFVSHFASCPAADSHRRAHRALSR